MTLLDWLVLSSTLLFIVIYGTIKTRRSRNIESYLRGDNQMGWATIGLSVMATQASAITFLSTPGLAFESGMGFVQNYIGLPIALIIVSAFFIPIYYRLKVYTAYEYLEHRFDLKVRLLAAFIFLVQRGLAAGLTIYAPAIILSTALGWDLSLTILAVGILVIIYTVSGGTRAVSLTQKWQMSIIMIGMFIAFGIIISGLPEGVGLFEAVDIAGNLGKMEVISFSTDRSERYTFWTGISGGLILALSYFGTDQSQVQRYLGGKGVRESRLGLMFNAVLKIPMQFFILFTGVMVFVFFQFQPHPLIFNKTAEDQVKSGKLNIEYTEIEGKFRENWERKKDIGLEYAQALNSGATEKEQLRTELKKHHQREVDLKDEAREIIRNDLDDKSAKDSDYVFLRFIMEFLPNGLVGLLLAVILSAAMSSTSGELNALGSTTMIDFYKRLKPGERSEKREVLISKLLTMFWGILAVLFALYARLIENLIEAVNILGSVFYGTILGIFLVAFFIKFVGSRAVLIAAIIAQISIFVLFARYEEELAYLWYNLIGCGLVVVISLLIQVTDRGNSSVSELS